MYEALTHVQKFLRWLIKKNKNKIWNFYLKSPKIKRTTIKKFLFETKKSNKIIFCFRNQKLILCQYRFKNPFLCNKFFIHK